MPTPTESRVDAAGIELAVFEWPGAGPPLIFAHATGFHARCWDEVICGLAGRHCLAPDLPGHGRSAKPPPPYHWRVFGEALAGLAAALDLHGAIIVGHSMGGHTALLAASLAPECFAGLLLIDPVVFPSHRYGPLWEQGSFAARRRNHWESPQAMVERFRNRLPFSAWNPRVLADYCTYGLLPAPDGHGFVLACPPQIEASIFIHSSERANRLDDVLATIDIPVWVLRCTRPYVAAAPDMQASPTDPTLAARLPRGRDIPLADLSHFIPMEDPALVSATVRQLIDTVVAR